MRFKRMCIIPTLVGAFFVLLFASNALASPKVAVAAQANHDFIPGGISKTDVNAAWSRVNSRAFVDPNMRQAIATQANVTTYDPSDWRVIGYGKASPGTGNSSVLNGGQVAAAPETSRCHVGAQVLIAVHKVTGAKLEICTACGNPRLRRVVQRIPKRPWALGTVINISRHVSKPIELTCPSGQKVSGKLDVWLKERITGRTWGTIQGAMDAKMKLRVDLAIKAEVKLNCGPAPVPPPLICQPPNTVVGGVCTAPAPPPAQPVCTFNGVPVFTQPPGTTIVNGVCVVQTAVCTLNGVPQFTVPAGFVVVGGVCIQQAQINCTAMGGTWNGSMMTCTIIQVVGTCSNITIINGNNNTTTVTQQGNCNTTPPPPANQPPVLSNPTNTEEAIANGETIPNRCVTVSGKNGNSMTVTFGSVYGTMLPSSITFVSNGVDRVCSTYRAPNDSSAVGKNDQIAYGVHDNTTGLNGQLVQSLPFPIKAPKPNP